MFHDVLFPTAISYGSKGGPKFSTSIIPLASGKERRNINWVDVRAEYDVAHGIKDVDQMEELRGFFYARNGRAYSFRFKDHADYTAQAQEIGIGDGTTDAFQLKKVYESGTYGYERTLTKPVEGTITLLTVDSVEQEEDVDFTVDYTTGIVTFTTPPGDGLSIVVGYFEFDVHCRFDTDYFDPTHEFWQTESWSSIIIVEIKD